MSEAQDFKRFPAIRCWIKHILDGKYSAEDKVLYTIFGKVKRIRIVATIIEKREILNIQGDNDSSFLEEKNPSNLRIEFDLDDGTGLIRAILWSVSPEQYENFDKGNIVDIVGLIRHWKGYISISPEIIKMIEDPNFILLRNAEILKRIKAGDIQVIPEIEKESEDFLIDEISDEIDIKDIFEENNARESDDPKEKVYSLIEERSLNGSGISLQELKKILGISEGELKSYVRDLEMESRIYQSEENVFQTY
jgi:RPA family protein